LLFVLVWILRSRWLHHFVIRSRCSFRLRSAVVVAFVAFSFVQRVAIAFTLRLPFTVAFCGYLHSSSLRRHVVVVTFVGFWVGCVRCSVALFVRCFTTFTVRYLCCSDFPSILAVVVDSLRYSLCSCWVVTVAFCIAALDCVTCCSAPLIHASERFVCCYGCSLIYLWCSFIALPLLPDSDSFLVLPLFWISSFVLRCCRVPRLLLRFGFCSLFVTFVDCVVTGYARCAFCYVLIAFGSLFVF